jgi:hypothetical protein
MIVRTLVALGLAASACPALADTTAVYAIGDGDFAMTMTVEIADNGDVRSQMSGPIVEKMPKGVAIYSITRGGEDFMVNETPEGVSVFRMSDMMTVMAEGWAKAREQTGAPDDDADADAPDLALVARGERAVNGRPGTAYYLRSDKKKAAPVLVISRDPALAQLGRTMARQFGRSIIGMQSMGVSAKPDESMLKALNEGAPLLFGGMAKLRTVRHEPVPADRFVLPAQPKTLDETRTLMTRKPPAP